MEARQDGLSRRLEALIQKLPAQKQSLLRELLMSLLEPVQKMRTECDSLARLEEKYLLALKEDPSNILDFRPLTEKSEGSIKRQDRRWTLKVPSLIEASSSGEIFRMAFELHLRSSRSIFLSWHDIDPASRQNFRVLLELTACTIFIPDIASVQSAEQLTILQALRDPAEDKPHFLAGTNHPYADLQNLNCLNRAFLDAMSQAYLKLTKPVAQYKREGLIRYFLESLS